MFNFKRHEAKKTVLDDAIDHLVGELAGWDGQSQEYSAIAENVKTLCEADAAIKAATKPNTVSAETIAMIAGNLAGIVMILSYEHVNIVTSKALGFVLRTKV